MSVLSLWGKKIIQSHVAQCNHDILQDHSFQQSNKHCPSWIIPSFNTFMKDNLRSFTEGMKGQGIILFLPQFSVTKEAYNTLQQWALNWPEYNVLMKGVPHFMVTFITGLRVT